MQKELQFLEEQDISPTLLAQVEAFRQEYPADEKGQREYEFLQSR